MRKEYIYLEPVPGKTSRSQNKSLRGMDRSFAAYRQSRERLRGAPCIQGLNVGYSFVGK